MDVGALGTIIDGQFLGFDSLPLDVLPEAGLRPVKREGQQLIAVRGGASYYE